jgi:hypothetical protein
MLPLCFKHIVLSNNEQLKEAQVLLLRKVFPNTDMNRYKMNLYDIIYIFYIQ